MLNKRETTAVASAVAAMAVNERRVVVGEIHGAFDCRPLARHFIGKHF
jgi:hypothetical protein